MGGIGVFMRRFLTLAVALGLGAGSAVAEDVSAVFAVPEEFAELPVTWSATPTDLPPEADLLKAMVFEEEARTGPWTVNLKSGTYLVSAFSATEVFELSVTVTEDMGVVTIPPMQLSPNIPFRCNETICSYSDEVTGLQFALPNGWAAEQPYRVDPADGDQSLEISAVFFEDRQDDGAAVWFLNPAEWFIDENGPCQEVSIGVVCTFEITESAKQALQTIAPSLSIRSGQ